VKVDCIIGVIHATAPVVARRFIAKPRHMVNPVCNWASHPGKAFLPRPGERFWEAETRELKRHHL
jgi:hypothetical protein